MMKNNISHEYAEALFLLSCEEKKEEEYLNDLKLVKDIFDSEKEYIELQKGLSRSSYIST